MFVNRGFRKKKKKRKKTYVPYMRAMEGRQEAMNRDRG